MCTPKTGTRLLLIDPDQRRLIELLSSIAEANAPGAVVLPPMGSLLLLLLLVLLMLLILNYEKSIEAADQFFALAIDAADQFFLAVSKVKRIGVPPLLRTKSAMRLQHCNGHVPDPGVSKSSSPRTSLKKFRRFFSLLTRAIVWN